MFVVAALLRGLMKVKLHRFFWTRAGNAKTKRCNVGTRGAIWTRSTAIAMWKQDEATCTRRGAVWTRGGAMWTRGGTTWTRDSAMGTRRGAMWTRGGTMRT